MKVKLRATAAVWVAWRRFASFIVWSVIIAWCCMWLSLCLWKYAASRSKPSRYPIGVNLTVFNPPELHCVNKVTQLCALRHRWFRPDHTWGWLHKSLDFLWGRARLWHWQWIRQLRLVCCQGNDLHLFTRVLLWVARHNDDFVDVSFMGVVMVNS